MLPFFIALLVSALPPSTSDAYLWQREVDPAVVSAFAAFSSGRLHVLAFDEVGAAGRAADPFEQRHPLLLSALVKARVPVVLTARLQSLAPPHAQLGRLVKGFVDAGVNVVGLEIDHDCASSKLPAYARWLSLLKTEAQVSVLITALPTWLTTPAHRDVFDVVDEVTLQLHAIAAPTLFDVDQALALIAAHPSLRVALPTYAVSLRSGQRLFAHPVDLAKIRRAARQVSWFRWPAPDDDSAWDLATLLAVERSVDGHALHPALITRLVAQDDGTSLLQIQNTGDVALPLPAVVVAGDLAHDAFAGFVADDSGTLAPTSARFVQPGDDVVVGWARPLPAGGQDVSLVAVPAFAERRPPRR